MGLSQKLAQRLGWLGILVGLGGLGLTAFIGFADPAWVPEDWRPIIAIGGLSVAVACLIAGVVVVLWPWMKERLWPKMRRLASRVRIPLRVVRVVEREPQDATTPGSGHRATAPTNTQPTAPTSTQPRANDGRPPFADDPRQLLDYLDSLPLLQKDDALRRYQGIEVVWKGELQSLTAATDDRVLLQAWFDRGKRRYFLAAVPRVAGLEALNSGEHVKVTGTIDSLGPPYARLDPARVIF